MEIPKTHRYELQLTGIDLPDDFDLGERIAEATDNAVVQLKRTPLKSPEVTCKNDCPDTYEDFVAWRDSRDCIPTTVGDAARWFTGTSLATLCEWFARDRAELPARVAEARAAAEVMPYEPVYRGSIEKFGERGRLVVDFASRQVSVDGSSDLDLSNREFELLAKLCEAPKQVWTKRDLLVAVWGFADTAGVQQMRTLDIHALLLRRKLDPERNEFVVNCWGVGYRLLAE